MTLQAVPEDHRAFLQGLVLMHQKPDLAFVHAGIRPGIALNQQDENDLVWIRQEFLHHTAPHSKLIVHGHTPVDRVTYCGNRLNLDTGAGYGRPASVVVFEGRTCWELTEKGRVSLV